GRDVWSRPRWGRPARGRRGRGGRRRRGTADPHAAVVAEIGARALVPGWTGRHDRASNSSSFLVRLLPGPDCLGRPGVERHLVGVIDLLLQPYGAGRGIDDVHDLGEQLGGAVVAGLLG